MQSSHLSLRSRQQAATTGRIRFTFQEYFRRMSSEPARWSQPFAALLGAYNAQLGFGLPSIGGKDSMSGTFDEESGKEIDVPPTLVSFAVDVASAKNMISPEFKKAGNKIVVFEIKKIPMIFRIMPRSWLDMINSMRTSRQAA